MGRTDRAQAAGQSFPPVRRAAAPAKNTMPTEPTQNPANLTESYYLVRNMRARRVLSP